MGRRSGMLFPPDRSDQLDKGRLCNRPILTPHSSNLCNKRSKVIDKLVKTSYDLGYVTKLDWGKLTDGLTS